MPVPRDEKAGDQNTSRATCFSLSGNEGEESFAPTTPPPPKISPPPTAPSPTVSAADVVFRREDLRRGRGLTERVTSLQRCQSWGPGRLPFLPLPFPDMVRSELSFKLERSENMIRPRENLQEIWSVATSFQLGSRERVLREKVHSSAMSTT